MDDKLSILKTNINSIKSGLQAQLEEVKKVPDHKRQDSTLWLAEGQLCAIELVLHLIEELQEE